MNKKGNFLKKKERKKISKKKRAANIFSNLIESYSSEKRQMKLYD